MRAQRGTGLSYMSRERAYKVTMLTVLKAYSMRALD